MTDLASSLLELAGRYLREGAVDAAASTLRRLTDMVPNDARAHLGYAGLGTGSIDERARALAIALAIAPQWGQAWHVKALNFGGGLVARRRSLVLEPNFADWHNDLGLKRVQAGDIPAALAAFHHAFVLAPDGDQFTYNLACAFKSAGFKVAALASFVRAAKLNPRHGDAYLNLGVMHQEAGRADLALPLYRRAVEIDPNSEIALTNQVFALRDLGQWQEAVSKADQFLDDHPDFARVHLQRGLALKSIGLARSAIDAYQRALALLPDLPEAHSNLAQALLAVSTVDLAQAPARRAVALAPQSTAMIKNLMFTTRYHPDLTAKLDAQIAQTIARHLTNGHRHINPIPKIINADPDRQLRIGYLSSDLKHHPVSRNLWPLLRGSNDHHTILFNLNPRQDDETKALADAADEFISLVGCDDTEIPVRIAACDIDILFITAAHFDDNRPWTALYRPAPIIINLFDVSTTGLSAFDYIFGDPIVAPNNGPEWFAERVIRTPHVYAHDPILDAPPVNDPPSLTQGFITFGSFNNPGKINHHVWRFWGRILAGLPKARLCLHYRNAYADFTLQRRVLELLGVPAARVEFSTKPRPNLADQLQLYQKVDIALDPFPFSGSTTTFEALWMGVPVMGPAGDMMITRWSKSLMHAAGLGDLTADLADESLSKIIKLASDPARLAEIRQQTRARLAQSYVCDGKRRRRDLDRILRAIWHIWCRERTS
jgi:predicted O-linked N-acetylglucosamine transferase (SPINDLY family)